MGETLVICIGNAARGDDGVAHEVARLLGPSPGCTILSATALDITHAEDVAGADSVYIVDAVRREGPPVESGQVLPGTPRHTTHGLDPGGLLAIAERLYGRSPSMTLIAVAAPRMEHGEDLSPVAEAAARKAADLLRELLAAES